MGPKDPSIHILGFLFSRVRMIQQKASTIKLIFIIIILAFISACYDSAHSDCDQVALLKIEKKGPVGWKEKEPCEIVFITKNDSIRMTAGIKCRGGVSSRYSKHSYTLELTRKYNFCNLPFDDDWILNANYIDKTFMRHKLSYDLYRSMNSNNVAPQSAYLNLELNDKPRGLYLIMEEVNASMAGLDKRDTLSMIFKDPPVFYEQRRQYFQDSLNYYQQKYPKIDQKDQSYYLERFKTFLFHSTDPEFAAGVGEWVDIENILDWQILLLLSNNGDGVMKNFLLYKIDSNTPFRIALWDYDHSFGRDGDNELNFLENVVQCERSVLLERLMNIPDSTYPDKLKKRWFELRANNIISFKGLQKMIEANRRIIEDEIVNNSQIWPLDSEWYFDSNSFEQEVQLMLDFIDFRIKQLDEYFNTI